MTSCSGSATTRSIAASCRAWLLPPPEFDLGREQKLRDLNIADAAVTALIAARWQKHPDCMAAGSAEACTRIIQDQPIVTPASIAADSDVELIYSDF